MDDTPKSRERELEGFGLQPTVKKVEIMNIDTGGGRVTTGRENDSLAGESMIILEIKNKVTADAHYQQQTTMDTQQIY